MTSFSPPLKWHGGKTYLAKWIRSLAPEGKYLHRVHPYGGGLAEFWCWPHQNISEVVNDIDEDLMNLWQVLRNPTLFQQFQRYIEATPFSQSEFQNTLREDDWGYINSPMMRAVNFFIQVRQSRQGLRKDFATLSRTRTRRGMNEQTSSWLTAIEGLSSVHARLKRVVIINDNAIKVIKQQDGPKTFFYLDPPYLHQTRMIINTYRYEMSSDEHEQLLTTLSSIQGMFALSGYHSEMYDEWAANHGYTCHERVIDNKASSAKTKEKRVECLWCNYEQIQGDNE